MFEHVPTGLQRVCVTSFCEAGPETNECFQVYRWPDDEHAVQVVLIPVQACLHVIWRASSSSQNGSGGRRIETFTVRSSR